ncbi:NERD domain-containing protein [Aquisalibacillus elongatus]|uniref:Nuclease-like protein n=1 Tax=Aquisalibacillus elongatus TaxID=485577 RepID=A0A3N5B9T2_9BACI|nr:NERD domain-containing protein [Aquisalibacillus elongatus]RPF54137.1 nuclease-like protein [Aquisalibacillus elongatus]
MEKPHVIPVKLLKLIAAKRYIRRKHPIIPTFEQDIASYSSGYQGELSIDFHINHILDPYHKLHNLYIPFKTWHFEIDTLLLLEKFLLALEIKNLRGDVYLEHEAGIMRQSYQNEEKRYQCPIVQVEKQARQLNHWLNHRGHKVPVETLVVFVNPNVKLHNQHPKTIYPYVLSHIYYKLKNHYRNAPTIKNRDEIASQLIKASTIPNPDVLSQYQLTFDDFEPGGICENCLQKSPKRQGWGWVCPSCHNKSLNNHIHTFKDLQLLFGPEITTTEAAYWLQTSTEVARYLLKKENYRKSGSHKRIKYHLNYNSQTDYQYLLDYNKNFYKMTLVTSSD